MSVGIIGLGYVGLPLVVAFAEVGEHVVAVDLDPRKVAAISAGESYVEDISSERLQKVQGNIEATSHYAPLARTDAVLICVPTPLTPNREPDLSALIGAGQALGQVLQRGQLIILESTTYPGTTRESWCRSWSRSPTCGSARASTWRSRPSASTPAAPTISCATRRRWWAA